MTTVHFYRLFHMAHHQYTNDPERDPDFQNLGQGKRAGEFPMERGRFIRVIYFALDRRTDPVPGVSWAYFQVNTLGQGKNVYVERGGPRQRAGIGLAATGDGAGDRLSARLEPGHLDLDDVQATGMADSGRHGRVWAWRSWSPIGCPIGPCFVRRSGRPIRAGLGGVFRLGFFTVLMEVLAHLRWATGGASAVYFTLLWLVPLNSSFMYFMFLRDVYQHSNADAGRLTNSRVFFTDPFTRWAVFVYGQDMHIPHHLFPAVPHYHLRAAPRPAQEVPTTPTVHQVVETHGTFHDTQGPAHDPG